LTVRSPSWHLLTNREVHEIAAFSELCERPLGKQRESCICPAGDFATRSPAGAVQSNLVGRWRSTANTTLTEIGGFPLTI